MNAKTYLVSIQGATPLLFHYDNIQWAAKMAEWSSDPANKAKSVAGDDRSPAFRWIGCMYHDQGKVVLPSDNLMTMLREGGARCPTGKRGATFKRQTQSGMVVDAAGWPMVVAGKTIDFDPIAELIAEPDFAKHETFVRGLGFELFVKRARVGNSKHVRVRPRFNNWSAEGTVTVFDETITERVLTDIVMHGGMYAGLGDWRPSSPRSPGPFGKFTAKVTAL